MSSFIDVFSAPRSSAARRREIFPLPTVSIILTFFKKRPALGEMHTETGLHHIGLQVDDLEAVKGRFLKLNPRGMIIQEPNDLQHGEIRFHDPECRPVTVSTQGFGVPASKEKMFPRVRHIAYNALDPDTMLLFYTQVFGLREIAPSYERRRQGRGNRFCVDGKTNLAIHPFYSQVKGTKRSTASTTSVF